MYKLLFIIALVLVLITTSVQAQSTIYLPVARAPGTAVPLTDTPTPNLLATQLAELQTAVATMATGATVTPNQTVIALEQTVTALVPTATSTATDTPTPTATSTATDTPTPTHTATSTATPNLPATLDALATIVATLQTPAPTATQGAGGTIPQP